MYWIRCSERWYAECSFSDLVVPNVILINVCILSFLPLNVVLLDVILLNVVLLNVVLLKIALLNVVLLNEVLNECCLAQHDSTECSCCKRCLAQCHSAECRGANRTQQSLLIQLWKENEEDNLCSAPGFLGSSRTLSDPSWSSCDLDILFL